jgi:DNA-binding NarL/FixJ family response regulator
MTHRILIVDDQKDVSRLLRSALETIEHGLEVAEAPSGEEAMLEAARKKVDLLISDFRLPGITGVELVKKFRARNPDVKIILITGVSDTRALKEIDEVKADAYFSKPVPMADFLDAVERTLGLARTIVSTPTEKEPEEPEPSKLVDALVSLRQDLRAIAVVLLDAQGKVEAEAGTLPDPNTAIAFISNLMGMYTAGQKAASLFDQQVRPVHLFRGQKTDGIFQAVGSTHAIFVAGEALADPGSMPTILARLAQCEFDILEGLEEIGAVIEMEPEVPGGVPAYVEPFTQPQDLPTDFMKIFDQVGKKATDANSFWDDVVEKGTTYSQPDKLTYEQAARLGLAPDSSDDKKE